MKSNYEGQEIPSLSGWQDVNGVGSKTKYSFTNDVPINGGRWSLKINYPDTSFSDLYYVFKPVHPSLTRQYILTFWYKTSPMPIRSYVLALEAYGGGYLVANGANSSSTKWTQETITYYSNEYVPDSFYVAIHMFGSKAASDSSNYVLFNSFKVEEY
jgi:hypothetical protein